MNTSIISTLYRSEKPERFPMSMQIITKSRVKKAGSLKYERENENIFQVLIVFPIIRQQTLHNITFHDDICALFLLFSFKAPINFHYCNETGLTMQKTRCEEIQSRS